MATVSHGTITITDLLDTATYIYYSATGSSTLTDWHVTSQTTDKYIGIYSGPPVDGGQPANPTSSIYSAMDISQYVGVSVVNVIPEYCTSNSSTIAPVEDDPGWDTEMLPIEDGDYLWIRQRNELSDGRVEYSDAICDPDRVTKKNVIASINVSPETISIDANKVNIAGLHVTQNTMYSGNKSSIDDTNPGFFFDNSGNVNIGDREQFITFYEINADQTKQLKIKTNNFNLESQSPHISLGNENNFHIYINADPNEMIMYPPNPVAAVPVYSKSYGVGFFEGNHTKELIATSGSFQPTVDIYYDKTTGEVVTNPNEEDFYDDEYLVEKDKRIAYINGQKLSIPYTVVLKGMQLGNKWIWELNPETDNLTLKWTGGE